MAELYAAKAEIKDDRVKELAYTDATFTEKAYTESALTVSQDAGVKIAAKNYTLDQARRAEFVTLEEQAASTTNLKEFDSVAYATEKQQAETIFNDGMRPIDEQAAGEIIKEISDDRFDGKVKSKEKRDAAGNLIKYKSTKGGMNKQGTVKTTIKTKKKAKDVQATVKKKTKTVSGTRRSKGKKSIGRTSRLKV